jgi:hypothetical protein
MLTAKSQAKATEAWRVKRAQEIQALRDGLASLEPNTAAAILCDFIASAPLTNDAVNKIARAANDRQWAAL